MRAATGWMEPIGERLRRVGQRLTTNRRMLVETLRKADNPLTIPEILRANRKLAMSSAYRNLAVLEQAGVVHRIVTTDEFARYELAEDLTVHHHHMICTNCGKVEDFTASPNLEESAISGLSRIAAKAGFDVRGHRLDVLGLCRDCG
jgi:Fur family transcriptional regulator, ferric uptake regulator